MPQICTGVVGTGQWGALPLGCRSHLDLSQRPCTQLCSTAYACVAELCSSGSTSTCSQRLTTSIPQLLKCKRSMPRRLLRAACSACGGPIGCAYIVCLNTSMLFPPTPPLQFPSDHIVRRCLSGLDHVLVVVLIDGDFPECPCGLSPRLHGPPCGPSTGTGKTGRRGKIFDSLTQYGSQSDVSGAQDLLPRAFMQFVPLHW